MCKCLFGKCLLAILLLVDFLRFFYVRVQSYDVLIMPIIKYYRECYNNKPFDTREL